MVEASVLMSLQLFIFAKRSLKPFISGVKVGKVWEKQKALQQSDYTLKTTHESNVKASNAQCAHICHSVFAKSTSALSCFQPAMISDDENSRVPGALSNVVEESDVVIWLGDLNYRLELPRSTVQTSIKHNRLQELCAKDQLPMALRKGQAFKGFKEGPLFFPPTFKYDNGTDNYDSSSKFLQGSEFAHAPIALVPRCPHPVCPFCGTSATSLKAALVNAVEAVDSNSAVRISNAPTFVSAVYIDSIRRLDFIMSFSHCLRAYCLNEFCSLRPPLVIGFIRPIKSGTFSTLTDPCTVFIAAVPNINNHQNPAPLTPSPLIIVCATLCDPANMLLSLLPHDSNVAHNCNCYEIMKTVKPLLINCEGGLSL